jgi:hypothetical protein
MHLLFCALHAVSVVVSEPADDEHINECDSTQNAMQIFCTPCRVAVLSPERYAGQRQRQRRLLLARAVLLGCG